MNQPSTKPLTANVTRSESDELVTHWYGWLCFVSSLFWPRICLLTFWIFGQFMYEAFHGRWALQGLGFLLLPWTTTAYALMWGLTSDGVSGREWVFVGLALVLDVGTWILGRNLVRGLSR